MKRIGDRSWRNRTSRFLSTGYLESDGRCGGGLCHYFVFLCHAYVSWVAQFTQSSSTLLSDKKVFFKIVLFLQYFLQQLAMHDEKSQ